MKALDGSLENFNGNDKVNRKFTTHRELRHLYSQLETRITDVITEV